MVVCEKMCKDGRNGEVLRLKKYLCFVQIISNLSFAYIYSFQTLDGFKSVADSRYSLPVSLFEIILMNSCMSSVRYVYYRRILYSR